MDKIQAWLQGWVVTKGSGTSGNYGHKGRRGRRGGSLPGGGHSSFGMATDATPDEVKERILQHREAQTKKDPRRIARGDYVRHKDHPQFGGQVVGEGHAWGKSSYQVRNRIGDVYALPKADAEKITREEAIRTQLAKDEPEPSKVPQFDEQAERNAVLQSTGPQSSKPREGITPEQVKRFFKRRDAVNAAKKFKYSDGSTAYSQVLDTLKKGMTELAKKTAGRLELTNPQTGMGRLFKRTAATNFIRTLLNIGDFARNY